MCRKNTIPVLFHSHLFVFMQNNFYLCPMYIYAYTPAACLLSVKKMGPAAAKRTRKKAREEKNSYKE